jgi:hypothetical protein
MVLEGGDEVIIHAMPARKKYLGLLPWPESSGRTLLDSSASPPTGAESSRRPQASVIARYPEVSIVAWCFPRW